MQPAIYETLKDFQPLIAATVALVAAALAFSAAMAKVRFDRREVEKRTNNDQLALLLRLESAAREIVAQATAMQWELRDGVDVRSPFALRSGMPPPKTEFTAQDLALTFPSELDEAWKNLNLLPPDAVTASAQIRKTFKQYNQLISNFPPTVEWTEPIPVHDLINPWGHLPQACYVLRELEKENKLLSEILLVRIQQIRRDA